MSMFTHLPVERLPDGWRPAFFGDVVSFRMGKTPPRNEKAYWGTQDFPWVSISDMSPYGTILKTAESVSEIAHRDVFRRQLVPAGHTLMSFKLTIGRVAKLGIPAYHNEAIISFRPEHPDVDEDFLFYYLSQIEYSAYRDKAIKGDTLNKSKLKSLEIALPPLDEQRQIAAVLSAVQRAIERQERLIDLTIELKKALTHKLLSEGTCGEPLTQTEIGPVPVGWSVKRLGDLVVKVSKGSSPRWQGYEYVKHGVLFMRSQNIGEGRLLLEEKAYLDPSFNEDKRGSILCEGDILVNLVGASIGRIAIANSELEGANCNQAVGFVRSDLPSWQRRFVVEFLLSEQGQRQLHGQKKDIARANLSLDDVKNLRVPVPPEQEGILISQGFERLYVSLGIHERRLSTLNQLFRSALHALMTAQVRVYDLDLSALEEAEQEPIGAV